MIKEIVELLKVDDYYGVSERIDIAKGKYKAKSALGCKKNAFNK